MALSKVNFNSMNVTPAASKAIKFNSNNNGLETGDLGGQLILLETQTLSSAASTVSFTSNIDSTYNSYIFRFYDVHPATNSQNFTFQTDTGTNTNYNQTVTGTFFYADHSEGDASNGVAYNGGRDTEQATGFIQIAQEVGNDNDQSCAGTLELFNPASTTFTKHFMARTSCYLGGDFAQDTFLSGYFNTTTAITRLQFKFASFNIDAGTFKMYGVV